MGVSAGGLDALCAILKRLPRRFGFALILVQHRSPDSDALCEVLQNCSGMTVTEAVDKEAIETGGIYLAPADYHLMIDEGCVALSLDAPEFFSRPSIDLAFESVADYYGERAIGVVLTGANRDGARGLRHIVERGGAALVQDPKTAEVPVMPLAALHEVPEAGIVTLAELVPRLCEMAPAESTSGVSSP